ncbi:hypothetical protein SAMN02745166_03618 [Prosthecobacter debontii]|uniref:Uncharacterized protein n=1 Tax=Prosthecobacter debontii TaxID=48467 RepID=A0A1T4YKF0_9BACT|nr:hypothetical protein SAMN02745166_03618 [Prosthecobacter debontii]
MILFRSLAWVIFCIFLHLSGVWKLNAETSPSPEAQKTEDVNIHQRGGMLLAFTAITVAVVGFVLTRKRQPPRSPPSGGGRDC